MKISVEFEVESSLMEMMGSEDSNDTNAALTSIGDLARVKAQGQAREYIEARAAERRAEREKAAKETEEAEE